MFFAHPFENICASQNGFIFPKVSWCNKKTYLKPLSLDSLRTNPEIIYSFYKMGPLPVISRVITPLIGVIAPVAQL